MNCSSGGINSYQIVRQPSPYIGFAAICAICLLKIVSIASHANAELPCVRKQKKKKKHALYVVPYDGYSSDSESSPITHTRICTRLQLKKQRILLFRCNVLARFLYFFNPVLLSPSFGKVKDKILNIGFSL